MRRFPATISCAIVRSRWDLACRVPVLLCSDDVRHGCFSACFKFPVTTPALPRSCPPFTFGGAGEVRPRSKKGRKRCLRPSLLEGSVVYSVQTFMVFMLVSASVLVLNVPLSTMVVVVVVGLVSTTV